MKEIITGEIERKIASGETDKAIELLELHFNCHEVTLIVNKYNIYWSNSIKGIYTQEQIETGLARINNDILIFLKRQNNLNLRVVGRLYKRVLFLFIFFISTYFLYKTYVGKSSASALVREEENAVKDVAERRRDTVEKAVPPGKRILAPVPAKEIPAAMETQSRHTFRGRVIDSASHGAVPQAYVAYYRGSSSQVDHAFTDTSGKFEISVIMPESYTTAYLTFEKDGYHTQGENFSIYDPPEIIILTAKTNENK